VAQLNAGMPASTAAGYLGRLAGHEAARLGSLRLTKRLVFGGPAHDRFRYEPWPQSGGKAAVGLDQL
jgi:hypothetical protein